MIYKLFVLICLIMSLCSASMEHTTTTTTTTTPAPLTTKSRKQNTKSTLLDWSLTTIGHMEDLFVENYVMNKYISKIFKEINTLAKQPNVSKMTVQEILIYISQIPINIQQSGYLEVKRMNAYNHFDFYKNND